LPLDPELSLVSSNRLALRQWVTRVFELLRDPVHRYLLRLLDSCDDAGDLTREVFLRVYAHLHRGHTVENVRAWVFRVAHNLAIDQMKIESGNMNAEFGDGVTSNAEKGLLRHLDQEQIAFTNEVGRFKLVSCVENDYATDDGP
jgi:DNA-directed RNA polymerase specialized sigma24 family protein